MLARSTLAAAATLCATVTGEDGDEARGVRRLGRPARRQEDMLLLFSITGAIRTNTDVVPQALREFIS